MKALALFSLLVVECIFAQTLRVAYPPFSQQQKTGVKSTRQTIRQTSKDATESTDAQDQVTWQVPFASAGNRITLIVQNGSSIEAKDVSVTINNHPSWIELKSNTLVIKRIAAEAAGDAEFVFSVSRRAPVGRDTTLTAVIKTSDGHTWTKEIKVSVAAPKNYKLYGNFPNPFNPSTKLAFELPGASHVRISVYDNIGREVARIADGEYTAGYNELTWNGTGFDGSRVSSGVYFCRFAADSWNRVIKMMLLK